MKRASLRNDLRRQFKESRAAIHSIVGVQAFVNDACTAAATDPVSALFGQLRTAGELLPHSLDSEKSRTKSEDRVPKFIQMQLFVAMIATVEGMLSEMISLVLLAFPGKIDAVPTKDAVIAAGSLGDVREAMVEADLNKAFYAKPAEYRRRIEQVISAAPLILDPSWDAFAEHKASRDVGLHNGWRVNEVYARKAGGRARMPDGDGYIYPDSAYFQDACSNALGMIDALEAHCESEFKNCRPGLVFRDMWERSALAKVVPFENAWELYGDGLVAAKSDFSWGWSGGEQLVFEFFQHIHNDSNAPPQLGLLRRRWAGSETAAIVGEWFEAPFFL